MMSLSQVSQSSVSPLRSRSVDNHFATVPDQPGCKEFSDEVTRLARKFENLADLMNESIENLGIVVPLLVM